MKIVTIFGSSLPGKGSRAYAEAQQLGKLLAEAGFAVCNGGYSIDGQVAIYEYFIPDQELISDIIKDKLSPNEIKNRTLMNQMGRSKVMVFLDRLEKGLVEKTSLFDI